MATVSRSVATLRISGDMLAPADITRSLGVEPTSAQTKGQVLIGKVTGKERVARIGMWSLKVADAIPADLDAQVNELLSKLTQDLSVWAELRSSFDLDLFVGLFLDRSNEGISLSEDTLRMLGERGISLGLDIYGGEQGVA